MLGRAYSSILCLRRVSVKYKHRIKCVRVRACVCARIGAGDWNEIAAERLKCASTARHRKVLGRFSIYILHIKYVYIPTYTHTQVLQARILFIHCSLSLSLRCPAFVVLFVRAEQMIVVNGCSIWVINSECVTQHNTLQTRARACSHFTPHPPTPKRAATPHATPRGPSWGAEIQ